MNAMRILVRLLPLLSTTTTIARSTGAFQPSHLSSSLPPLSIRYNNKFRHLHQTCFPSFPTTRTRTSTTTTPVRLFARMPRNVKKQNLPSKVCVVCNRPFTWRKKWEKVWDEVSTCSKSCNRERRSVKQKENRASSNFGEQVSDSLQSQEIAVTTNKGVKEDEMSSSNMSATDFEEIVPQTYSSTDDDDIDDPVKRLKLERKLAKKQKKAERRAALEGRGASTDGQKNCDVCSNSVDLLIRCTIDETARWQMVCGRCWNGVSGGVVDGDAAHPHYRYGGLWKNRRAVST